MINSRKLLRRFIISILNKSTPEKLRAKGEGAVLRTFRHVASKVPAYKILLEEAGIEPKSIKSISDFKSKVPVLGKHNTFARFPMDQLCVPGMLENLAGVLTSSGHGARFAYGLSSKLQAKNAADDIDLGLQYAFQVDDKKTLLINCLPMGVRFTSNAVTIAETSVREDMAVAIANEIGPYFEQIIFAGDPLFFKLLTDYARDQGVDWGSYHINLIIGEETFGEHYRDYLADHFQIDPDDASTGLIGSSMGVGELGLNLFYETRQTIVLRRLAHSNQEFHVSLFGLSASENPLPMLFVYNPLRTYVEILNPDKDGYGQLTISMMDKNAPLPLLRYQTGDVARFITPECIEKADSHIGHQGFYKIPLPLIAIKGRDKDQLPDGVNVSQYKDALYMDKELARLVTGALRLETGQEDLRIHVQLRRDCVDAYAEQKLSKQFPGAVNPDQITVWKYEDFPFGITLDYERKFNYYIS